MLENYENVRNFCRDEKVFCYSFCSIVLETPTSYLTKMQVYKLKLKGVLKNSFRYPPKVFR